MSVRRDAPAKYGPLLLVRDGSLCCWCGQTVHLRHGWHVDHWLPVSRFPELAPDPVNWRLAHSACNLAKADKVLIAPPAGVPAWWCHAHGSLRTNQTRRHDDWFRVCNRRVNLGGGVTGHCGRFVFCWRFGDPIPTPELAG
ncbi:MAG: HNH endonuclease [Rhodothermaceae bacterium]|nr:HNH endonuclease [Rhodothermaceae bacterium]